MIAAAILTGIRTRLAAALAPPRGDYVALDVDGEALGWLAPARAARLARFADCFVQRDGALRFVASLATADARSAAIATVTATLAREGALSAWRNERYAVAPTFDAPPAFLLERAAARYFGIRTYASHVNGLVQRDGELQMWIARRSPTKSIDSGMLDNLVGGGIAAGASIADTVIKEAWEEAGIAAVLARTAQPAGRVDLCREQPDGLQRETIHVHDLMLPPDFAPANQDGEVVDFRCVALPATARLVALTTGADVVTADASLVIVDCLLRHRMIDERDSEYGALTTLGAPQSRYAPAR
jgi:8-oxo-dGTP pyrophosphatase MutT (NUDIX family)